MTTQTKALSVEDTLKLALEALEDYEPNEANKAITAIKDVLEAHKALANHIPDAKNMVAQPSGSVEHSAPHGEPDYAYPTIKDYEEIVGFEVGNAFKMGWTMARTTNVFIDQLVKGES